MYEPISAFHLDERSYFCPEMSKIVAVTTENVV